MKGIDVMLVGVEELTDVDDIGIVAKWPSISGALGCIDDETGCELNILQQLTAANSTICSCIGGEQNNTAHSAGSTNGHTAQNSARNPCQIESA